MEQPGASRRERFGYRKEGTGRETSPKRFNLGMRTGWMMPTNLPKDADGDDDLEALLEMGLPPPKKPAAAAAPSRGASSNGVGAEGMHSMSPVGASFEGDGAEYTSGRGAGALPAAAAAYGAPGTAPKLHGRPSPGRGAEALDDDAGDVGFDGGDDMRDNYDERDYDPPGGGAAGGDDDEDVDEGSGGRRGGARGGGRPAQQPAARKRPPVGGKAASAAAKPPSKKKVSYVDDAAGSDSDDGGSDSDRGAGRRRHRGDDEDEDAGFRRKPKKGAAGSSKSSRGGSASRGGSESSKPRKRSADRDRDRSRDRGGDDEDDDGGADYAGNPQARMRPSLHVGSNSETGLGKRRRWQPLNHWAGERVVYDVFGAKHAEKTGAPSPLVARLGKRKRSTSKSRSPSRGEGGKRHKKGRRGGDSGSDGSSSDSDGGGGRGRSRSRSQASDGEGRPRGRSASGSRQRGAQQAAAKRGPGRPPKPVAVRKHHRDADDADGDAAGSASDGEGAPAAGAGEASVAGTRLQRQLSPRHLPRGFREARSPTLTVPASDGHPAYQIAIVRDATNLAFEPLPAAEARGEGLDALAAAAFDAPEFISGTVRMRPLAVKDEESTHNCTQVFVVTTCQPKALEVRIAGQRYLLSPGDHFFVPQSTMYSMVNHSPSTTAEVAFVVIKAALAGGGVALEGEYPGEAEDAAAAGAGASPIPPQPRLNSPSAYDGGGEGARGPHGGDAAAAAPADGEG